MKKKEVVVAEKVTEDKKIEKTSFKKNEENKIPFSKRLGAYLIDYLLISILITCIGSSSFINKDYSKYNKVYNEYVAMISESSGFLTDIESDYSDSEISEEEYKSLKENYPTYIGFVDKYYEDGITKDEYDKIYNEYLKKYKSDVKYYSYNLEKNNMIVEIITIVINLLYFVLFVYFVDGVSLGKKLFKLKIVNKNGSKVSIKNLMIRTLFITSTIYSLFNVIGVLILKQNEFYYFTTGLSVIQLIVYIAIIVLVCYRNDGRGLHDLLGGTKVISTKGE